MTTLVPWCSGCCYTHIAIVTTPTHNAVRSGIAYYNRKGFNVQMICDSDLRILEYNARYPGATHDSAIWSLSAVKAFLRQKYDENDLRSMCLTAIHWNSYTRSPRKYPRRQIQYGLYKSMKLH